MPCFLCTLTPPGPQYCVLEGTFWLCVMYLLVREEAPCGLRLALLLTNGQGAQGPLRLVQ